MKLFIRSIVAVWFGVLAGLAHAQELVTDRPDATESSVVVPKGSTQLEVGYLMTDGVEEETHEILQTLVRISLAEWAELRLGWGGYVDGVEDGAADGELGAKVHLAPEQGLQPEVALLASVSVPMGDDAQTSDEWDPAFRFALSHTLSETLSLGYNLGVEWGTEGGSTGSTFIYSAALGIGLSERLGMYLEIFGGEALSAEGGAHSFDGGFTYLLKNNLQLDILGGVGLSGDAEDWFAGGGLSWRFPN